MRHCHTSFPGCSRLAETHSVRTGYCLSPMKTPWGFSQVEPTAQPTSRHSPHHSPRLSMAQAPGSFSTSRTILSQQKFTKAGSKGNTTIDTGYVASLFSLSRRERGKSFHSVGKRGQCQQRARALTGSGTVPFPVPSRAPASSGLSFPPISFHLLSFKICRPVRGK